MRAFYSDIKQGGRLRLGVYLLLVLVLGGGRGGGGGVELGVAAVQVACEKSKGLKPSFSLDGVETGQLSSAMGQLDSSCTAPSHTLELMALRYGLACQIVL